MSSYHVVIAESAERDIDHTHAWWSENRSKAQADNWYVQIHSAIATLSHRADGCPLAPETELLSTDLRQLSFGIRAKPTHRIVFTIDGTRVVILRVRHVAQRDLTIVDLN
jgi:plasmid stabilization system protein ParE